MVTGSRVGAADGAGALDAVAATALVEGLLARSAGGMLLPAVAQAVSRPAASASRPSARAGSLDAGSTLGAMGPPCAAPGVGGRSLRAGPRSSDRARGQAIPRRSGFSRPPAHTFRRAVAPPGQGSPARPASAHPRTGAR